MSQNGSIAVRVFTSRAQIPVVGATVALVRRGGRGKHALLALRATDENGEVTAIPVAAPDAAGSESPGTSAPFATLDIWVEHPDYELEIMEDVQVFAGVESLQMVQLLPLAEHAAARDQVSVVRIPPQTL